MSVVTRPGDLPLDERLARIETRLDSIERTLWRILGAAAVIAAGAGFLGDLVMRGLGR